MHGRVRSAGVAMERSVNWPMAWRNASVRPLVMIYATVASCGAADHWSADRILRLMDQHVSWSCLLAVYRRTSLSLITGLVKVECYVQSRIKVRVLKLRVSNINWINRKHRIRPFLILETRVLILESRDSNFSSPRQGITRLYLLIFYCLAFVAQWDDDRNRMPPSGIFYDVVHGSSLT